MTAIDCLDGFAANRRVLMGFAPAALLHRLSYADVLDEETGRGYQRRFNAQHSLDFRRYIQGPNATTIPLTFNLRPDAAQSWKIVNGTGRQARLEFSGDASRVFTQVDCQHRLGHLSDLTIDLPFMTFIGLDARAEMEIFNVINGKAKGLSASLLDFHDAQLTSDLGGDRPELFIALYLKNEPTSPWHRQLDLGGSGTSGMTRRASLRTVQKAVKRFLARTKITQVLSVEEAAHIIHDFWAAVPLVLPDQWARPRKHLLSKGIGVYALMDIAADLYLEAPATRRCDRSYFSERLSDFVNEIDWSSDGDLRGLGGEGGVKTAVAFIRDLRRRTRLKVISSGQ